MALAVRLLASVKASDARLPDPVMLVTSLPVLVRVKSLLVPVRVSAPPIRLPVPDWVTAAPATSDTAPVPVLMPATPLTVSIWNPLVSVKLAL